MEEEIKYWVQSRQHKSEDDSREEYDEIVFNETPFDYFELEKTSEEYPFTYNTQEPFITVPKEHRMEYPLGFENRTVWLTYRGKSILVRLFRSNGFFFSGNRYSFGRELSFLLSSFFGCDFLSQKRDLYEPPVPMAFGFNPGYKDNAYVYPTFTGEYSYMGNGETCPHFNHILTSLNNGHYLRIQRFEKAVLVGTIDCLTCPCFDGYDYETERVKCKMSPFKYPDWLKEGESTK